MHAVYILLYIYTPLTGVPASPPVHSDTRAHETHSAGLLENDLGTQSVMHTHALPSGGEGEGKELATSLYSSTV